MSPEQAAGKFTDPRSDIFSVAAIAYELLTGSKHIQPAKLRCTSDDYVAHLLGGEPLPTRRASELRPEIPELADEALAAALSRDWNERPPDVSLFVDDLVVVLRAYGPPLGRPGLFRRTLKLLRGSQ